MTDGQLRHLALSKGVIVPALAHTDPDGTAATLTSRCPGITVELTVRCEQGREPVTVFRVGIEPPQQFAALGYPTEVALLVVSSRVLVFPVARSAAPGRRFKHRNPTGDLCLYYSRDDAALVWWPADGLEQLLAITQRHFAAEEYWRRHSKWPLVDAPHGEPMRGTHPIRDGNLERVARDWKRVS